MRKKTKTILKFIFLLLLIGGTAWILIDANSAPYWHMEGKIFGTYYHITYQSSSDYDHEILERLEQVDASLSAFNPQSTVSLINRNETTGADEMFDTIFDLALQVSSATDGAFDITVAPLVNLWGFGFNRADSVSQAAIDSIMTFVGYKKVSKSSQRHVKKQDPRTMLDFSAIAKGYGCDQAAAVLRHHGISNYLVEIGGEICAAGLNPEHKTWSVGIIKPIDDSVQSTQQIIATLRMNEINMATSGNYRNYYVKDGKRYAHTIDPHSGHPVQHSLLSATVLAPTCAMADAYATAFMVMGLDKAKLLLNTDKRLKAYLIYSDGTKLQSWHSPSLDKFLNK